MGMRYGVGGGGSLAVLLVLVGLTSPLEAQRRPAGDAATPQREVRMPIDDEVREYARTPPPPGARRRLVRRSPQSGERRLHHLLEVGDFRESGLDANRALATVRRSADVTPEAAARILHAVGYPPEVIGQAVATSFRLGAREAQLVSRNTLTEPPLLPENRLNPAGFEVTWCILPDGELVICPKNSSSWPDLTFLDTSPPSGATPPGMVPIQGGFLHRGQYGSTPPMGTTTLSPGDCGTFWSWYAEEARWRMISYGCLGDLAVPSFFMSRHEVTWAEWQEVRGWALENGYELGEGFGHGPQHPVQRVSWYDAVKWSNARSEMEGLTPVYRVAGEVYRSQELHPDASHEVSMVEGVDGWRLPTEAEWEFAARGGMSSQEFLFSGSDNVDAVAVWIEDHPRDEGTAPVGSKAPNELGLYDMSGNVWEWVWDAPNLLLCCGRDEESRFRRFRGGSAWDRELVALTPYARRATYPAWETWPMGFRTARWVGDPSP